MLGLNQRYFPVNFQTLRHIICVSLNDKAVLATRSMANSEKSLWEDVLLDAQKV
jgi:hypothetical protein